MPLFLVKGLITPLQTPLLDPLNGLETPTHVVNVNALIRFDEGDIPYNKFASQCLDEFDNYIVKQEHLYVYVRKQLKRNAFMVDHLSDLMFRIANDVQGLGKHSSMVQTQLEQVTKSQNDFLNETNDNMNDHDVRVMTRGGRMTQEP